MRYTSKCSNVYFHMPSELENSSLYFLGNSGACHAFIHVHEIIIESKGKPLWVDTYPQAPPKFCRIARVALKGFRCQTMSGLAARGYLLFIWAMRVASFYAHTLDFSCVTPYLDKEKAYYLNLGRGPLWIWSIVHFLRPTRLPGPMVFRPKEDGLIIFKIRRW